MSTETIGPYGGDGEFTSGVPSALEGFAAKTWVPHKYQARGIDWLLKPSAALFLPPGLGKSSILLAAICKLKSLGFKHRTLLLAPLMVCRTTWVTEPAKWRQFQDLKIGLAHGPDKKLILNDPYWDIVVMNYDGLEWAVPMLAAGHNFEILACDEITRLKNTNSKRYKLIKPILPSFKFRWGLTGTPTANGLMDLFGQVYVMDLGARLGRFITHFRLKYFHQIPHDQYRYYITPEKTRQLTDTLLDLAMYVEPEEWLDLPEFLVIPLEHELEQSVRKQYDFLEDEFMLQVGADLVTSANAGVLTSKLRQFTGGAVYTAPPIYVEVGTAKLDRLDDLIEEMAGEPLMVAYQFDHERERIMKRHPTALALKGGMLASKVQAVVEAWNSGNAPLLLVQPQTAALGLNLQFGGSAICWFTTTYNLEEFIQLNKRLHRQGQTKAVRCYLLAALKTIDQRVAKVLAKKDVVQYDVFQALKLKM
jgi:SNF2 family DNA or RNA helicase